MVDKNVTALGMLEQTVGIEMREALKSVRNTGAESTDYPRFSAFRDLIGREMLHDMLDDVRVELYPLRSANVGQVASFVDILFMIGLREEARSYVDRARARGN